MRTPERCPWCGAEENIRKDGVRTGTYHCGAMLLGRNLWGGMHKSYSVCPLGNTFAAAAYRQTLAWRKRLSQHTGVPLRAIPKPAIMRHGTAMWPAARIELALAGPGRWGILAWGHGIGWIDGAEARRRLLAKGGE
jgi:hypothetical protein